MADTNSHKDRSPLSWLSWPLCPSWPSWRCACRMALVAFMAFMAFIYDDRVQDLRLLNQRSESVQSMIEQSMIDQSMNEPPLLLSPFWPTDSPLLSHSLRDGFSSSPYRPTVSTLRLHSHPTCVPLFSCLSSI